MSNNASSDGVYTLEELDELEEYNELNVTSDHLVIAMNYIGQVLDNSGIPYAVMGGMQMIICGFDQRMTTDVDIAVQSSPRDILRVLAREERILRPQVQSVAGSGVARIFVATGPMFGENVDPLNVEVDLILAGNRGAPRHLDADTVVAVEWDGFDTGEPRLYNVLSLKEILKAKIAAYYTREAEKDMQDVTWMCMNLADDVRAVSRSLSVDHTEFYYEGVRTSMDLSDEALQRIFWALRL